MADAARVKSIDALREFKRALTEFSELAGAALAEANTNVQRVIWWIQHDQRSYWEAQKKKRTARLALARNELFRAQVSSPDQRLPATLERRAVEKTERALEEAETKLQNIKRWSRLLERDFIVYKAQCQHLANALEGDVPKALGKLERMFAALQKYVRTAPPTSEPAVAGAEAPEADRAAEPKPGTPEAAPEGRSR